MYSVSYVVLVLKLCKNRATQNTVALSITCNTSLLSRYITSTITQQLKSQSSLRVNRNRLGTFLYNQQQWQYFVRCLIARCSTLLQLALRSILTSLCTEGCLNRLYNQRSSVSVRQLYISASSLCCSSIYRCPYFRIISTILSS